MQIFQFLPMHLRSITVICVVLLLLSHNKALAESKMEEAFLNEIRAAFKSHDEQDDELSPAQAVVQTSTFEIGQREWAYGGHH